MPKDRPATDRAERLAAALRENLKRRKQQARSAGGESTGAFAPSPEDITGGSNGEGALAGGNASEPFLPSARDLP